MLSMLRAPALPTALLFVEDFVDAGAVMAAPVLLALVGAAAASPLLLLLVLLPLVWLLLRRLEEEEARADFPRLRSAREVLLGMVESMVGMVESMVGMRVRAVPACSPLFRTTSSKGNWVYIFNTIQNIGRTIQVKVGVTGLLLITWRLLVQIVCF